MEDQNRKGGKKHWRLYLSIYGVTILLFLSYFLFFSEHNLKTHRELNRKIDNLKSRIANTKNQIGNAYTFEQLSADSVLLEKYARENLNMHRPNEDVFIIIHE